MHTLKISSGVLVGAPTTVAEDNIPCKSVKAPRICRKRTLSVSPSMLSSKARDLMIKSSSLSMKKSLNLSKSWVQTITFKPHAFQSQLVQKCMTDSTACQSKNVSDR